MDDHLVLCREEIIIVVLHHLNSFHPLIKFAHETEIGVSINYLDLTISRQNGTNWYTKPASNRILNFYSAHPRHMIRNVAIYFAMKVFNYSDPQFHQNNMLRVREILMKNNFPLLQLDLLSNAAIFAQLRMSQDYPRHSQDKFDISFWKSPSLK